MFCEKCSGTRLSHLWFFRVVDVSVNIFTTKITEALPLSFKEIAMTTCPF
jgi:hypothetical protein